MIFWARDVSEEWDEIRLELERAFVASRTAAQSEESLVYVVHMDDLLGRRGAGRAMVAAGLLSAARSAALEGIKKGWTANMVAFEEGTDPETIDGWTAVLVGAHNVTGELVRLGPGHVGKALP